MSNPSFTNYYMAMMLVTSVLISLFPFIPTFWYFVFSIKLITHKFQIWRLFTNFLIAPSLKLGIGFIFQLISLYKSLSDLEINARTNRKYSSFIMLLFYLSTFIILSSFLIYFTLGIKESRSLVHQLIFAIFAISSYREPNKRVMIYFFPVKNKYFPFALMLVNIISGGYIEIPDLIRPIIGFIIGYFYVVLNDKYNLLKIPFFLQKLCKDKIEEVHTGTIKESKKKKNEILFTINHKDNTNTAFREKGSVAEGNEFTELDREKEIKWE